MNHLKISIITPSFNQGIFLEETICSVISQKYPNLEYILIDGGSTDSTIDIIHKYEQFFSYWISELDRGQSHAINKGFAKANGDIIIWLNSDDTLMPGSLELVNKYFSSCPSSVGVVHGGTILFDERGDLETNFGYKNQNLERSLSGNPFPQPSAFIRKKYLDHVGLYLDEDYHYMMDYGLFSKLALVSDFYAVNDVFSKYRLHNQSKTVSLSTKFIEDLIRIFINLIQNLELKWTIEQLGNIGVFESYFYASKPFDFQIKEKSIEQKQLIFYFLCYVLKNDYVNNNFSRIKPVYRYLTANYPYSIINTEHEMQPITNKIKRIPFFILKYLKKSREKFNEGRIY